MALTTREAGSNAAIWLLYRNAEYALPDDQGHERM